eukprot:COSAG06_NODE_622_length_13723_cov_258.262184_14_plen_178_part_00
MRAAWPANGRLGRAGERTVTIHADAHRLRGELLRICTKAEVNSQLSSKGSRRAPGCTPNSWPSTQSVCSSSAPGSGSAPPGACRDGGTPSDTGSFMSWALSAALSASSVAIFVSSALIVRTIALRTAAVWSAVAFPPPPLPLSFRSLGSTASSGIFKVPLSAQLEAPGSIIPDEATS